VVEVNPILVKELRSRMRGARAFVLMTIYLVVLGGVTLLLYAALVGTMGSDLNAGRQIGKTLFIVISAVALIEVCLITPALTSGAIAAERERQTYDLLIASLLSPWQIVWGKLASALAFALLLILSVVPIMSLAFLFGGVSLTELLIALAGMVTTAVTYATLGLFWSSVMRGSLGATAFSIGSVVLILLGIPFLVVIFLLLFGRDASSDLFEAPFFIYMSRIIMCAHPFIALGLTDTLISSGSSPWFETVTLNSSGATLAVPSPWLIYIAISAIATAILLSVCVRSIHPIQPAVARREPQAPKGGAEPAGPTPP
jgi:ABC-2 type transport system permease protein